MKKNSISSHGGRRLVRGKKFLLYQVNHGGHGGWRTHEKCPWADRQGLEYLVSFFNQWVPEHKQTTVEAIVTVHPLGRGVL